MGNEITQAYITPNNLQNSKESVRGYRWGLRDQRKRSKQIYRASFCMGDYVIWHIRNLLVVPKSFDKSKSKLLRYESSPGNQRPLEFGYRYCLSCWRRPSPLVLPSPIISPTWMTLHLTTLVKVNHYAFRWWSMFTILSLILSYCQGCHDSTANSAKASSSRQRPEPDFVVRSSGFRE